MSTLKIAVTERKDDGTKWVHYFETREKAEAAVARNQKLFRTRTYEIREIA